VVYAHNEPFDPTIIRSYATVDSSRTLAHRCLGLFLLPMSALFTASCLWRRPFSCIRDHPTAVRPGAIWSDVMVMFPVFTESAVANRESPKLSLTQHEQRQLLWLQATVAAERQLVALNQPCTDHHACRRLAFALWLSATSHCPRPSPRERLTIS
jgi:hypothetical protein